MGQKKLIESCINFKGVDMFINEQNIAAEEMGLANKTPENKEEAKERLLESVSQHFELEDAEWELVCEVNETIAEYLDIYAEECSNFGQDEVFH